MAPGQAGHDAGEDDQRDAVADAALGDLLAEPHEEGGARGQRDDGHDAERPAGLVDDRRATRRLQLLEADADEQTLDDDEDDGAVARVLGDLAPPHLALLRQPLEVRDDDGHELQDDRRADVRHDAEGEDRELLERAAGEEVDEAEHRVASPGRRTRPAPCRRCPGVGMATTDAVHGQHAEREQQPAAQLGDAPCVWKPFKHQRSPRRCRRRRRCAPWPTR